MDPERILDELLELARRLGLTVIHDSLADCETPATSGVCRVYNREMVILDGRARPEEQIAALVCAIRGHDVRGIYVSPWVRELVGASLRSVE